VPKHPCDGTLRRLLDEPVAVTVADDDHASRCLRCQAVMSVMRDDDMYTDLALLGGKVEMTPASVALERLHAVERAGAPLAPARDQGWLGDEAGPVRRRRRPPLFRPVVVVTSALVLVGGATAAAATGLVPIFEPESVAPVVIQAGDIASLQALSRFGTVTGSSGLDLTPEGSASALASAAGFAFPTVTVPAGLAAGSASYWLVGADSAQLQISVAKAEAVAAKEGVTLPPAPPGVDGSILQVATGAGSLEVWGLTLPGGIGPSAGLFGASSSREAAGPGGTAAGPAPGGSPTENGTGPAVSDLPQLAVAEVEGPTVSSSGADLSTLEGYLLSQPGVSPELAAQIRAIGDPSSTLPIPVPAGATSSTVELDGHAAVVLAAGSEENVVVWADNGRLFAVLGQASASDLLDVARQIA
jgi:hypothetical protein